jgi:SAM-dependent methyltransferase
VYEILDHLPHDACVLDLGCGEGSFHADAYKFRTVRVDVDVPDIANQLLVQADATRLPFRARTFDAIVLNHCVEHFAKLKPALQEIGRVVKVDGAVFVSVPDARTLSDRMYRKVFKGAGGHVNLFASEVDLEKMLSWYFGIRHVATRTLHSGFTFLNRKNVCRNRLLRAQVRFSGIPEPALAVITAIMRLVDRSFGTQLTVYGWAFYFGRVQETVITTPMWNVCIRCGDSRDLAEIAADLGQERNRNLLRYLCPKCGASNFAVPDRKDRSSPGEGIERSYSSPCRKP